MIYLSSNPSNDELRDRFINFNYELNDGFDLAVLLNEHCVIANIDDCDVYDDRIEIHQLTSEKELLFFADKDNYVTLYFPKYEKSGKTSITAQLVYKHPIEKKYLNAVKRNLNDLLPWVINVDKYIVNTGPVIELV